MKKTIKKTLLLVIILVYNTSIAQSVVEKSINGLIGFGISSPYNSIDEIADAGIFAQVELVLKQTNWVEFRPYAGLIFTSSNGKDLNDNPTLEKAESKVFLLGAKARVRAPIPYIAPYLEIGLGTSIGKFNTQTAFDSINKSGIIYHIPFSFGLELGKNNNFDIGFAYYFQPTVKQFIGAFAIGVTFPIHTQ